MTALIGIVALVMGVSNSALAQGVSSSRQNLERVRIHYADPDQGQSGRLVTQTLSGFRPPRSSQTCTSQLLKQIDAEMKRNDRNYLINNDIQSVDVWVGSPETVNDLVASTSLTCRRMPREKLWYISNRKEPKIAKEGFGGWIDEKLEVEFGTPLATKEACETELAARKDKNYIKGPNDSTVVYVEVRRRNGEKVRWRTLRPKASDDRNYLSLDSDCDVSRFNMLDLVSRSNGLLDQNYEQANAAEERDRALAAPPSYRGMIDRSKPASRDVLKTPPTETKRLPIQSDESAGSPEY